MKIGALLVGDLEWVYKGLIALGSFASLRMTTTSKSKGSEKAINRLHRVIPARVTVSVRKERP